MIKYVSLFSTYVQRIFSALNLPILPHEISYGSVFDTLLLTSRFLFDCMDELPERYQYRLITAEGRVFHC